MRSQGTHGPLLNHFSNGLLTSTVLNNIYPIVDMKFDKDQVAESAASAVVAGTNATGAATDACGNANDREIAKSSPYYYVLRLSGASCRLYGKDKFLLRLDEFRKNE